MYIYAYSKKTKYIVQASKTLDTLKVKPKIYVLRRRSIFLLALTQVFPCHIISYLDLCNYFGTSNSILYLRTRLQIIAITPIFEYQGLPPVVFPHLFCRAIVGNIITTQFARKQAGGSSVSISNPWLMSKSNISVSYSSAFRHICFQNR